MFRDAALLGARLVLGGYLAAHGSQKLFGSFGGHALDGTGGFFESVGLRPGRPLAATAGVSELGGGVLTAAGLAFPAGPFAIASTMAVASGTVHRGQGAFAAGNGPELPLTNIAASAALGACGPGRFSLDHALRLRLPGRIVGATAALSAVAAGGLIARAATTTVDEQAETGEQQEDREADDQEARRSA